MICLGRKFVNEVLSGGPEMHSVGLAIAEPMVFRSSTPQTPSRLERLPLVEAKQNGCPFPS